MAAILKFFKRHLLPNCELDWAKTRWEASQWHRDSELLESFCSDIQDGCHGGHLEILQTTSIPKPYWAETWWETSQWHRDSKLLELFCSKIQDGHMVAILKFFKWYLLQNHKSDWAETLWEASEQHRDSELLRLFCSDIQDGRHGGHLEILQATSPNWKLDSAKTWWEASQWQRDSELLKSLFIYLRSGLWKFWNLNRSSRWRWRHQWAHFQKKNTKKYVYITRHEN